MAVPKVAAIHDLSGLGKCSLTAAVPVLSAMGVQACPLPTAVLSNQTGFSSYACVDLSRHLDAFTREWEKRGVRFDGVYTGFLCGARQVRMVERFLDRFYLPGTLLLVDPVLGDNGKLYPVFGRTMCDSLKSLVARADVITPNLTEACILADGDYASAARAQSLEPVWELAERLAGMGPRTVIVTGVHRGDLICNAGFDARTGRRFSVGNRSVGSGRSFSGTGDLLASVLCGGLVRGETAEAALEKAARLLEAAISDAEADGTDPNEGVPFENHLDLLIGKEG